MTLNRKNWTGMGSEKETAEKNGLHHATPGMLQGEIFGQLVKLSYLKPQGNPGRRLSPRSKSKPVLGFHRTKPSASGRVREADTTENFPEKEEAMALAVGPSGSWPLQGTGGVVLPWETVTVSHRQFTNNTLPQPRGLPWWTV